MPDESGEILRMTKESLQHAKNSMRREMEAPITPLAPEAREDAQKVSRELWVEGMKLLGGKDKNVRRDSQDRALIINGKNLSIRLFLKVPIY